MSNRNRVPSPPRRFHRRYVPEEIDLPEDDEEWGRSRRATARPLVPSPARSWEAHSSRPPPLSHTPMVPSPFTSSRPLSYNSYSSSQPRESRPSSGTYLAPPEAIPSRRWPSPEPLLSSDDLSDSQSTATTSQQPPGSSSSGTLGDKVYRYRALAKSEFRLVRLFRRTKTDIRCEILHESLLAPPSYTAISYAWGDAGDTRNIKIQSVNVPISASLHGALEALRQRSHDVLVWADALCIDQQNHEERSEQVRLMTDIYAQADYVAVWLGDDADDSALGMRFLGKLSEAAADSSSSSTPSVERLLTPSRIRELEAVATLFERDYWSRLWVVQEIFNARDIRVFCGGSSLDYGAFARASTLFARHRELLNALLPATRRTSQVSPRSQFSIPQVLVHQGPASFPDFRLFRDARRRGDVDPNPSILLEALCRCRRKFAADPRDKVFGILGVLPPRIRDEFEPDYSLSPKEAYTEVVDYLLTTTLSLNVLCEAIHFPLHINAVTQSLPSFVPDWSHTPSIVSLAQQNLFAAAGNTQANCRFLDPRHNKLEIAAIHIDSVSSSGISVGTLCTLTDYLMAFLQWRALLLGTIPSDPDRDREHSARIQQRFCRTLCLDQIPAPWDAADDPRRWQRVVYHIFASFLRERLPHLALDDELTSCLDDREIEKEIDHHAARRGFVQDHFGERMMGRRFFLTEDGLMGMGSGFMAIGDVIVVPLGCDMPILLRPEGRHGEYRFVGEVYVHGYMRGRALEEEERGKRKLTRYVLH